MKTYHKTETHRLSGEKFCVIYEKKSGTWYLTLSLSEEKSKCVFDFSGFNVLYDNDIRINRMVYVRLDGYDNCEFEELKDVVESIESVLEGK